MGVTHGVVTACALTVAALLTVVAGDVVAPLPPSALDIAGPVWYPASFRQLVADGPNPDTCFGRAVATSSSYALVSADCTTKRSVFVFAPPEPADGAPAAAGSGFVAQAPVAWSNVAVIQSPSSNTNDEFGWDVALSGRVVVVGSRREGAHVFAAKYSTNWTEWTLVSTLTLPSVNGTSCTSPATVCMLVVCHAPHMCSPTRAC